MRDTSWLPPVSAGLLRSGHSITWRRWRCHFCECHGSHLANGRASTSQRDATHVYLLGLDHHIKRALKVPSSMRYGDDICCFGESRAALRAGRAAIGRWLWDERGVRLKHPEARILSCAGHLDALGHRVRRARIEPLGRARRRWIARVAAALDGRGRVDIERSIAASAGVVLF